MSSTENEETLTNDYRPFYLAWLPTPKPIVVSSTHPSAPIQNYFTSFPLFSPLLFPNFPSDARDHLANERTFLSFLRLSVYLSVVSVAILISFHLKNEPTPLEKHVALPLGIVFFVLALVSLVNAFGNYVRTLRRYSRKQALVQSGWKTQVTFAGVAMVIVGCCILFLSVQAGVNG